MKTSVEKGKFNVMKLLQKTLAETTEQNPAANTAIPWL